ncbi:MAG: group II intron reverse transcriptase/maturase [Rhodomicrobium sp.]
MSAAKPFDIPKKLVAAAFRAVKNSAGGAGIDKETIGQFESKLKDNLYKIWNRMSSGTYFPPPVKAVAIPKKSGGERILGVPTVSDRVAQMVVKMVLEPALEPVFLPDSYGYRPEKSALDAVAITRERCWKHDWVLEFDIKALFDNIDHGLLLKALDKHTDCKWVRLYIERWLTAPLQLADGKLVQRARGTPQGGVVSPLLANLFLHYTFDVWMTRTYPKAPWCRYADDGLVHCGSVKEAQEIKLALEARLAECGLQMHPAKTKIVYCKDGRRTGTHEHTKFTFLGYEFRGRGVKVGKTGNLFTGFTAAVSPTALTAMRQKSRRLNYRNRSDLSLQDIASKLNPILRGWIAYYGRFQPSALAPLYRHINKSLVAWARRKYKRFRTSKTRAGTFLQKVSRKCPQLFAHWKLGTPGAFA